MGVTIHFEGRLRGETAFGQVIGTAKALAEREGWKWETIDEDAVTLQRERDGQDWDYSGPVKGIVLYPHENSEPLRLEFDRDLIIQEFVKTQFAPTEIHVRVVGLLKEIAPHFESLSVCDEGEYWDTGDLELLKKHQQTILRMLADELSSVPHLEGPVRLPSGRIADLVTRK
jgi:hypothetical protein